MWRRVRKATLRSDSFRKNDDHSSDVTGYAPLWIDPQGGSPRVEGLALLGEVRSLLARLAPPRARNTSAIYSTGYGLVIVVPLDRRREMKLSQGGSLHISIQIHLDDAGGAIQGAWTDAHYAWDYVPDPEFAVAGVGPNAQVQAVQWLARELERPVSRTDLMLFGRTLFSQWQIDGVQWYEGRGLFGLGLLVRFLPTRAAAAGFLVPW